MKKFEIPASKLKAWQFDPTNNEGQPEFVAVSRMMAGVRATARPPGTAAVMMLEPLDWLVMFYGQDDSPENRPQYAVIPPTAFELLTRKV